MDKNYLVAWEEMADNVRTFIQAGLNGHMLPNANDRLELFHCTISMAELRNW